MNRHLNGTGQDRTHLLWPIEHWPAAATAAALQPDLAQPPMYGRSRCTTEADVQHRQQGTAMRCEKVHVCCASDIILMVKCFSSSCCCSLESFQFGMLDCQCLQFFFYCCCCCCCCHSSGASREDHHHHHHQANLPLFFLRNHHHHHHSPHHHSRPTKSSVC